ncbi:right-handed parallel beta-helix repeat-containing protein [Agrilutibacter solisilvae]|uniref:Right-handed parallel beta-helix repeat-containing protein n=1 Tax=Agrilutibacter solisilvae TaxID=2763317 RepID=A0A975ARF9_9GAMM|nr:right-handed parallel beta-helix repeat-containing protein [Lysobacter solisilvae]QSX76915.1 right-handed parallel beta-helix repeat-containing protein [Lysobacter solisilvae]
MLRTLTLLVLAAAGVGTAHAESSVCTPITSLPAVITSQGVYCLAVDANITLFQGTGLRIAAGNVTVDCNGHRITGPGAANGIEATDVANATVRNCDIRGFQTGILLGGKGTSSPRVENNTIQASTLRGIHVEGTGALIRGNRVFDTGGFQSSGTAGISVTGDEVRVEGNQVAGVHSASYSAVGISISGIYSTVTDNAISDLVSGDQSPVVVGIGVYGDGWYWAVQGSVQGNSIMAGAAATPANGFPVVAGRIGTRPYSAVVCKDNVMMGFSVPNGGTALGKCKDGGGNLAN